MTEFISLALLLGVLGFALLTRGAWWKGRAAGAPNDEVAALRRQADQLRDLNKAGTLTDEQFAQADAKVQARIAEYAAGAGAGGTAPVAAQPPSRGLLAAIALVFVVTVGGGYALIGTPAAIGVAPGMASAAGGGSHSVTSEQIVAMIDKLAERLKQQPDDAVGWGMLARSYVAIGRHADALGAYRKALALRANDADLLADYADALAVANNRSLDGEPMALIERALKADPNHVKALALAGTLAYNRKDWPLALQHWERAVKAAPPDNPFVEDLRNGIAEVRRLAGLEPAPATAAAAPAAMAAPTAPALAAPALADGKGRVAGTVVLAAALAAKADPQDTVFVFARPADGSRMPLAILKKQVRDLPLQFVLDDSLAMSPAAKISGVAQVLVSARVSKSGNATPQPGDLQGAVGPVPVGSEGLRVEIGEEVAR